MARTARSRLRGFSLCVLALSGLLALVSSGYADTGAETDVPAVKTAPTPQSVDAEIKLAGDYFTGHGVAQDLTQAAYWYEKAAEAGDAEAQMQTGYLYDAGIGVGRDPVRAVHWYQLAVSGGLARAKVNLAIAYLWGSGVERSEGTALRLLNEAAGKGVGLAACYLGVIYQLGIGVPQDAATADWWYAKGVKLHEPRAEYDLGTLLFVGKNHVHDLRAAANLLRESAAQGYVPAMHSLGLLLVRNPGLTKSADEGVTALDEAACAGEWRSSVILGVLARDGAGVSADASAAYLHFKIAVLQGGGEAAQLVDDDLKNLSAKLSASQVQALDSQAQDWYRHHQVALEFVRKDGENRNRFPAYALAGPEMGAHAAQILPVMAN
jgi:uncharacterized protein